MSPNMKATQKRGIRMWLKIKEKKCVLSLGYHVHTSYTAASYWCPSECVLMATPRGSSVLLGLELSRSTSFFHLASIIYIQSIIYIIKSQHHSGLWKANLNTVDVSVFMLQWAGDQLNKINHRCHDYKKNHQGRLKRRLVYKCSAHTQTLQTISIVWNGTEYLSAD